MPIVVPSKLDATRGVIVNMLATPAKLYDAAFNSYLLLKEGGVENHTLTLVLKIQLNKISTYGFPLFPHLDANKTVFWIKPWDNPAWTSFKRNFKNQCLRWNDRFWLTPPAGFSALDVKVGKRIFRPNIYCHLYVHLQDGPGGAHRTIDVVNLDKKVTAAQLGKKESDLNSGNFRSHEALYNSLDTLPRTNTSTDDKGATHKHANYLTIVHEIGHALGLPHISVTHGDGLCSVAMLIGDNPLLNGTDIGALLKGKSNSSACYGTYAPPSRSDNVMGRGTNFDTTNAQPWLDRIALHTATKASDWKASMTRVAPKPV